jgi:putative transposase
MYVFRNLTEVREHTERWLHNYNEEIPNTSLNGLTPDEYRQFHNPENSSYAWT